MAMPDTATSSGTTAHAGGRPRSTAADRAILEAAFLALTSDGYAQMSIEAVAAAAGVGKTTIYRRYPTKRELAAAAIAAMTFVVPPPSDQDVRTTLLGILKQGREVLVGARAMTMLGTLLVEERREPELIELFRQRIIGPRRQLLMGILVAAQSRGELAVDADLEVATDMLVGGMHSRYLAGMPIDEDWIDTAGRRPAPLASGREQRIRGARAATVTRMNGALLQDAFGHHVWATLTLLDACSALTPEQLESTVPGTYGSIISTLRHLVGADTSYLELLSGGQVQALDDEECRGPRDAAGGHGGGRTGLVAGPGRRPGSGGHRWSATVTMARSHGPRSPSAWPRSSTTARTTAARSAPP